LIKFTGCFFYFLFEKTFENLNFFLFFCNRQKRREKKKEKNFQNEKVFSLLASCNLESIEPETTCTEVKVDPRLNAFCYQRIFLKNSFEFENGFHKKKKKKKKKNQD